jgi:uncharacterized protein YdaU (DUF1376 family)
LPVSADGRPEAVSFYAEDFLAGTASMTLEQRGAYITLLCMQQTKGPLDMDDITAVTHGMASAKIVIKKFQLTDGGKYAQPRMEKEVAVRQNYRFAQQERANRRWGKEAAAVAVKGSESECRGITMSAAWTGIISVPNATPKTRRRRAKPRRGGNLRG